MRSTSSLALFAVLLFGGASLASLDLQHAQETTLVVYTTAALKDVLEQDIIPRYTASTGERVEPVYVAAGEQFNRLRIGGPHPEADVFLHASPMFIEQGYAEHRFLAYDLSQGASIDDSLKSRAVDDGRDRSETSSSEPLRIWYAFAWSPLVEVTSTRVSTPPDLATANLRFGLADPLLSNNGVYGVILYENVSREAGRWAVSHTVVQPVSGQATIGGIADGSFDLTLGYEAVTLQYMAKGARVAEALPLLDGVHIVVPVVFAAAVPVGHLHPDAFRFVRFLFANETQSRLGNFFFRPALPEMPGPSAGLTWNLAEVRLVTFDWSRWSELQRALPDYQVKT